MDEMVIKSKFMTNVIGKILTRTIVKKAGCNTDIRLNEVSLKCEDGKTNVHIDLDAAMEKEELIKLLRRFGVG